MTCLEPGKPKRRVARNLHTNFRAIAPAKFSCSHHKFMLDSFHSACGAQLVSVFAAPTTTDFFVLKFFPHRLFRISPHSPELRANSAFPATRSRGILLCTTHVAVIDSLLDNRKSSRSNLACAKNFFAKFSTRQKCFVLVCRLFYLLKFSFVQASAPYKREALCSN